MNKRAAKEKAQSGTITIGYLRKAIAEARGRGGVSRVNGSIPLDHALDIYEAAIAGRPDDQTPAVWRPDFYSRTGAMKPTGDALIIQNILRDCE